MSSPALNPARTAAATGGAVRAMPHYNPATRKHSWVREENRCRYCGIHTRSVQADEHDPRSWFKSWRWPDGRTGDNQTGGKLPECPGPTVAAPAEPLPRGARVQVRPNHYDASGRVLPQCAATVACHWVGPWEADDSPDRRWYDLTFDDGRFRTVAADLVSPLEEQP